MITFFITRDYRYTIETYLKMWAPDLRSQVRSVGYEDLPVAGELEPGTYIFCDQERWCPRQHRLAVSLWEQLEAAGSAVSLLNDPRRVLLRHELLKQLHRCGQNAFNVHDVGEAFWKSRFPAFLHTHGGHEGPVSPLLHGRTALLYWCLVNFVRRRRAKLMVEEFCDVSVEGVYAKYGAFLLRDVILPRHLFFGRDWALKGDETTQEHQLDPMEAYFSENPHAGELQNIFALAGIDYGRIDYAFHHCKLQVWEINTNPLVIGFIPEDTPPREIVLAEKFANRFRVELLRFSALSGGDRAIPYRLSCRF